MTRDVELPPGQREIDALPRFGLTKFIHRFPDNTVSIDIDIGGDVGHRVHVSEEFKSLPRVEQTADFHCVTTWTKRNVHWSGYRFSDFFRDIVAPSAIPRADATLVVFKAQDGYRVGLPLEDLMAPDVLLADTIDGQPLSIAHGAPLRLVAPSHYGYKSAKHVERIEFWNKARDYRPAAFRFMDHPRARVQFEERGSVFPGWLLRYLYRPLIGPTRRRFARALEKHLEHKKAD